MYVYAEDLIAAVVTQLDDTAPDGTYRAWVGMTEEMRPTLWVKCLASNSGYEVSVHAIPFRGDEGQYPEQISDAGITLRFGLWTAPDGAKHIDANVHVENKGVAIRLATEHNQQAIWDWYNQEAITVNGV